MKTHMELMSAGSMRGKAERLIWRLHKRGFFTFDTADRLVDVTCWGLNRKYRRRYQ